METETKLRVLRNLYELKITDDRKVIFLHIYGEGIKTLRDLGCQSLNDFLNRLCPFGSGNITIKTRTPFGCVWTADYEFVFGDYHLDQIRGEIDAVIIGNYVIFKN